MATRAATLPWRRWLPFPRLRDCCRVRYDAMPPFAACRGMATTTMAIGHVVRSDASTVATAPVTVTGTRPNNLLFFGGDYVSVVCLDALRLHRKAGCTVPSHIHVICPPAPHRDRSNPVLEYCQSHGVPVTVVPESTRLSPDFVLPAPPVLVEAAEAVGTKSRWDIAVVVSFRYYLPSKLLDRLPPVINMHPSLLPKFRGASPVFETVRRGERCGGVSVVKIAPCELMDCGDVLLQQTLRFVRATPRSEVPAKTHNATSVAAPRQLSMLHHPITRIGEAVTVSHLDGRVRSYRLADDAALLTEALADDDIRALDMRAYLPLLLQLGAVSLLKVLDDFERLWPRAAPQADRCRLREDPWHAPLLVAKDCGNIRWSAMTAAEAFDRWRAFVFTHHVHCYFNRSATPVAHRIVDPEKKRPCRVVLNECVAWIDVSDAARAELRAATASSDAPLVPGTAMFLSSDRNLCAVSCGGGVAHRDLPAGGLPIPNVLLISHVTLHNSKPVAIRTLATSMAFKPGSWHSRLFLSDDSDGGAAVRPTPS